MERQAILREVKDLLGVVPEYLKRIPDPHLSPIWESMRDLQLLPGKIPAKYQQLIMLAVATHANCKYGTDFHAQAAKALGVTDDEITETALLTGHTAAISSYLAGSQADFEQFKRDVRAACQTLAGNDVSGLLGGRVVQGQMRSSGH